MAAVFGVVTAGTLVGLTPIAKAKDLQGNTNPLPTYKTYEFYNGGFGNGWGGGDGNRLGMPSAAAPNNGVGGKGLDGSDPHSPTKGKGGSGGAVGSTTVNSDRAIIGGGAGNHVGGDGFVSAGGGGGGGAGVYLSNAAVQYSTIAGQQIVGGVGGTGGTAHSWDNKAAHAGSAGGGGAGAILVGTTLNNASSASIIGGTGGTGGAANFGERNLNGGGGSGGDGVVVIGGRFENYGTVRGGNGGNAGAGPIEGAYGAKGGSAVRIGDGGYVVNAGTLNTGTAATVLLNPSIPDPDAIVIVGNDTKLELRSGSNILGNVSVAGVKTGNTLILGGDKNSTFAVTEIGSKYKGFNSYKKTGDSVWSLEKGTTQKTNWTIEGGALSITAASSLGDASSILTLNGGGLQTAGPLNLVRNIVVGASNGTIDVQNNSNTLHGAVSGAGQLTKLGSGVLTVTGKLDQAGGVALNAGTLKIGDGGSIKHNVAIASGATLEFNHGNSEVYDGALSGTGFLKVDKTPLGSLTLTGDSSAFTGSATIYGTTNFNGTLGASRVTVGSTGKLDGTGRIMGNTTVESGGTLAGTQDTTMVFDKDLVLSSGSVLDLELGKATDKVLFKVGGDLTLKGTVNITSLGGFGAGTYRIFDYDGQLVNAATVATDVAFGTTPADIDVTDLTLDTSTANKVSILNTAGLKVNYWDGSQPGGGSVSGGSGIWNTSNNNWTENSGVATNPWKAEEFALFQKVGGTVTIDNTDGQVTAPGMQFEVDGYRIEGQPLELKTATVDAPVVRVGDGTTAGTAMTATIASEIQGNQGLRKTDYGTLILTGENSYDGATVVQNGTLQIGDGGKTGSIKGNIVVGNDDTDQTRLIYNRSDDFTVANVISGTGSVEKKGSGKLVLTGENTYTGGSRVDSGILQIGDGGLTGNIQGPVELVSGDSALVIDLAKNITLNSAISGAGGLTQQGPGVTTVTVATAYTGETKITDGELRLVGDGSIGQSSKVTVDSVLDATGATGSNVNLESIHGNDHGIIKIGDKNLNITDAKDGAFAGVIEGAGGHVAINAGTQRLSGENTYTGGTGIDTGATLIIGDGGTKGSVIGEIAVEGTLIYDRSDRYTVNPIKGPGDIKITGNGTAVVDKPQEITGEVVVSENNTLVVDGNGDLSKAKGVTNDGNLDVSGSNADDIRIGHVRGNEKGKVTLGEKNLVITNGDGSEYKGTIVGTGGFTAETGKQILSGKNTYTGDTNIRPTAELQLGNDDKAGSITSNVNNEGILSGNGSMKDLLNKGTVSPGTDTSFGTLTVNGNYTSENGKLILHEELGGDASKGDRLVIAGNTSGTTEVTVINRGGLGEQTNNGIKVIEVGGQSDGLFNLNGDYVNYRGARAVVAGAYAYTLEKGGVTNPDGNWYLRSEDKDKKSEPEYQVGVPVYGSAASGVAMINRGGFASFGTRMNAGGGSADSDDSQSNGKNDGSMFQENYFWGRVQGGSSSYSPNGSATGGSFGTRDWTIQTGLDGQFVDDASGQLFGSVWLDYTRSKIRSRSDYGNGGVDVNGYGLGAALTWYGANGFYLDGQGKATWYKSDFESDRLSDALASGVKSLGYALSIEAGQRLAIDNQWSVTPQAQLIWSSLSTDSYHDVFGAHVETPDNNSLTGRIGIAADYSTAWRETDNSKTQLTVGGIANIYQELKTGSDYITISDVNVATGTIDKTWGEIGATANYGWNNNKYSVYGKLSGATSLNNFGDSNSVSGNVGFRLKF